jgi:hypothetical protein
MARHEAIKGVVKGIAQARDKETKESITELWAKLTPKERDEILNV